MINTCKLNPCCGDMYNCNPPGQPVAKPVADDLTTLRDSGWSVAVHNDYSLGGKSYTFWLFTHPCGRWVKGEGSTDAIALAECVAAIPVRSSERFPHISDDDVRELLSCTNVARGRAVLSRLISAGQWTGGSAPEPSHSQVVPNNPDGLEAATALPLLLAERQHPWCPDVCPFTGLPFFMWIDGEPTYGGPFDSYTIPVKDKDGEFTVRHFDHDRGCWKDWDHNLGLRLIDDQREDFEFGSMEAAVSLARGQVFEEVAEALGHVAYHRYGVHLGPAAERVLEANRAAILALKASAP